jgi:RNA polymerase sigma-70 factor (ECF subfamily)
MDSGAAGQQRPVVFCLVPRDLAPRLHEQLRRHFADTSGVEVVVDCRRVERRERSDRRTEKAASPAEDRRQIKSAQGRRVGERRGALISVDAPGPLPRRVREHAGRIVFVERLEPSGQRLEDADTARAITRIQAGDRDGFAVLYMRYFDRVYSYLRLLSRDPVEAEDLTQLVFVSAFESLSRYRVGGPPFRAWLFTAARNQAIDHLRKHARVELAGLEPGQRDVDIPFTDLADRASQIAGWISDRELLLFVERLPLLQRQVLALRYMLDFAPSEIATILGRSPGSVAVIQSRALARLRERLAAVGRVSPRGKSMRSRTWVRPARIVRARRFALTAPGPNF